MSGSRIIEPRWIDEGGGEGRVHERGPTNPPPNSEREAAMCDEMTEERLRQLREGLYGLERGDGLGRRPRPDMFYPDGSPILSDELLPATLKWALILEDGRERIVGNTKTLYGERLSTVWLGLDHNFFGGPPLIYETMLFAPDKDNVRLRSIDDLMRSMKGEKVDTSEYDSFTAYTKKHYPHHDQLQLRYHTRAEAAESHEKLKLQCLIPPRWRHFLLWTIGQDADWSYYDDEVEL